MSIIDRASSTQSKKSPSPRAKTVPAAISPKKSAKRLAPGPSKSRKESSILDDVDAWDFEQEYDGGADEDLFREEKPTRSTKRPAPKRKSRNSAIMDAEVEAFGNSFRPAPASAASAASAKPAKAVRGKSGIKSTAPAQRSREFSFDHKRLEKFGFITPKVRRSRISEEFRLIKRRLMQRMSLSAKKKMGRGNRNHVILVTSARPSEGKSFVAMNLALSIIFDEGLNVLLVDGDVARPSMSKILGLRNDSPGLTDLLLDDEAILPDMLLREHEHPLTYLAAGAMVASATDLFGGERMETLVSDMAERYADRIIIFDAPPLLASTEPVALAEHAGQVVMVVDAEKTSRSAVDSALDLLVTDQNVNLVLNKTTVGNRTEQFGSYYEAYNQA